MMDPDEYRETIILRNADKEDEEYEDTEEEVSPLVSRWSRN